MFLLLCLVSPTRQISAQEKRFMLCCVAKDMRDMERKNCKKYPRHYCCVEEHKDGKILELHVQSRKKG